MKLPLSHAEFLETYWQQRPLLLPQAVPNFTSPLSPEELAGLALEPAVSSRLIHCDHGVWQKTDGPFSAKDFQSGGTWTLLVENVDQWHEGVRALYPHLSLLPTWRFDDVMVSYAVDGAGVGPHFDRYDVFLLQGLGEREWRIGPICDGNTPQMNTEGLSLIAEFEPTETYILKTGDVLYVPPGLAHWGVARGACMTYSFGFRAPAISDLIARRADSILDRLAQTTLLEDGHSVSVPCRPGEITEAHLANARDAIANASEALDNLRWFGEVVTEQKIDMEDTLTPSALAHPDQAARLVSINCVAWSEYGEYIDVFIAGEAFRIPKTALEALVALCSGGELLVADLSANYPELLDALLLQGALEPCPA